MSDADDAELARLQKRVFGPDADTHRDAAAIARLRELEAARRRPAAMSAAEASAAPVTDASHEAGTEPEPHDDQPPVTAVVLRQMRGLRRSTVLIVLGCVAFVALIAAALVLVPRVQTDPLQSGAVQVARLSVDDEFRVPDVFRSGADGEGQATGYEAFYGIRPVITEGGFFGAGSMAPCLAVYSDADLADPEASSFAGPIIGGCAVGAFPARAQFALTFDGFPDEMRQALPEYTGVQFVYDRENQEVVVFAG